MPRRSRSSGRWLARQNKDPFVKQAQGDGWRSRAVFKLEQIDQRDRLIRPGQLIVDLGCAPGSWSQYALKKLKNQGRILGLDLLPVAPLRGLEFFQGDFLSPDAMAWIESCIQQKSAVSLVMSDMAPNLTGNRLLDQARSLELLEAAAEFCRQQLKPGGDFLFKAFQGEDLPQFVTGLKNEYASVSWRKPNASRDESREVFVLARGYQMTDNR